MYIQIEYENVTVAKIVVWTGVRSTMPTGMSEVHNLPDDMSICPLSRFD